jgi:hypothetical protein
MKYLGAHAHEHVVRMSKLINERKDIEVNVLIREGDTNFLAANYVSYRWQRKDYFSTTSFYVFADYLALISFQDENAPKVILIHSAVFADAYRKQFMEQWWQATIPKQMKVKAKLTGN